MLFLRTDKVDVSVRGARRGMGRTGLAWWEADGAGLSSRAQTWVVISLDTSTVATGQVFVDRADRPLSA